jgi:hypothetical protein
VADLKTTLHFTIHGSKLSVEQIADELGISTSYLYRSCLEGDSGCRFPLDLLLPLMKATGDYTILDHLNSRCDRVTVSLPRSGQFKAKDPQAINEVQRNFNDAMGALLKFFVNPNPKQVDGVIAGLHKHLCEVAAIKRAVKTFHQGDLL